MDTEKDTTSQNILIDDPLRKAFAERGYLFADDLLGSDVGLFASHESMLDWLRKQRDEAVPIAGKLDRKVFISIDALIARGVSNYMRIPYEKATPADTR